MILFCCWAKGQDQTNTFQFGLYNDSWGGGFTPIFDDLRTYHFEASYQHGNRFRINGRYSLLTNRFDADTSQRKLLNEVALHASFPIVRFKDNLGGHIALKSGLFVLGDLLGSQIQSTTHDLFGVTQTELDYDEERRVAPSLGYVIEKPILEKPLKGDRSFQMGVNHSILHSFGYLTHVNASSSFSLSSGASKIAFTAGYYQIINHLNNNLVASLSNAESGLGLGLKVAGKRLFYHFQTYPNRQFSFGGVGARFSNNNENHSDPGLNLEIDMSVLNNGDGYNFKYGYRSFQWLNRTAKLIVNHNYQTFLSRYLPDYPAVNGHGHQLSAGVEINLLKPRETHRILEPYANLSVGNSMVSIYSKERDIDRQRAHLAMARNDLGFNIQLPLSFKKKTTQLALSVYNRFVLSYTLTPSNESALINPDNSPYATFRNNQGIGLRVKL